MSDEHRAKLLEIAARRGKKGFSDVVNEAVALYLKTSSGLEEPRKKALQLRGSLSAKEAQSLRVSTRRLRQLWRSS
ncbi:MAG: hypothetical protein AB1405_15590 [Bdellovibrionota bacterium]